MVISITNTKASFSLFVKSSVTAAAKNVVDASFFSEESTIAI